MNRVVKMSLRPRAVACLFGMTAALGIPGVHAAEVEMPSPAAVPEPLVQPMAPSPASPVAPLTDADRRAVYRGGALHDMGDTELHSYFVFDQLEWQRRAAGGTLNWNGNGWIGGDLDRLWLRTEGSRVGSRLEDAEVQALWGHSITPWWDLVAGVRHDFRPSAAQTWLAFGIQGLALYNFESEVTAFVGQRGQASLRVEGRYDLLITNRLILQPSLEANLFAKNDAARGQGAGLGDTSLGLRLRYEVDRQFAPYLGISWDRSYGNSARMVVREGGRRSELSVLAGVRVWF
ncbi:copper resistance protein B [Burkholderia gladioli pv. gladioli]|uniref:Copper resistance protein B n=3 Tax=Burkholderia gladioli TaxID=28095 RepID=A0AAW3F2K7_BURGA|nr:copper resistance protein B [Burkholderia gladioli]AJW94457.1 copper resistance protein B [Burkholderia gladioli]ASD82975.1 copper resistance protein B [Burkholderia gladioli pv. gladioli]AWY50409.1 copper resistance protein B [Burkholderia gladioli pv. gladioli]KGC14462.1 copper resistance protein B [Burkholderia gladioli]MBU9277041.1 copper resistance protein B [Burkholderia gladioli]